MLHLLYTESGGDVTQRYWPDLTFAFQKMASFAENLGVCVPALASAGVGKTTLFLNKGALE